MDDFTEAALAEGTYVAFTDGSCKGNPGPGGCAMRLYLPHDEPIEKTRKSLSTTNSKAEMRAVIDALEATPEGARVVICLDSQFIKDSFEKYLTGWIERDWRNSKGKPVKNQDMWKKIITLSKTRSVTFRKIKAHSGHPDNERVDELASQAAGRASKRAFLTVDCAV